MSAPSSKPDVAAADEAYEVFVSYRSTAKTWARRIKAALEGLAQPKNGDEPFRVFLDEASLLVGDLGDKITAGLKGSRALVVLMARDTVESRWVNREIEVWLENGGSPAHLFLIRIDDVDLSWDEEVSDWACPEVIPSALRGVFSVEQKYIDLSVASRGAERTAVAPVFAAVRERTIESLLLEEAARARRRQRTIMSVTAAIAVLLVVAVAAGIWALVSRNRAEAATHEAVTNLIASQARVTSDTDLEEALVLADTAFQSTGRVEHAQTLYDVAAATPELVSFFSLDGQATAVGATPDGAIVVAGTSSGAVVQFTRSTRTRVNLRKIEGEVTFVGISDDGRTVAASACMKDSNATCTTHTWTRWQNGTQEETSPGAAMALSPSGRSIAVIPDRQGWSDAPTPIEIHRGEQVKRYGIPSLRPSWLVLPDDTSITALNEYGMFVRVSHGGSVQRGRIGIGTYMFGGSLAQDGKHFTYTNGGESISVWDLSAAKGPEVELEAQYVGVTRTASVSGIALSPDGSRLVTASDGRLFVSDVVRSVSDDAGIKELAGAGPGPHDLRFVGQDVMVSAAGTSVALWDLARTHPFAQSWAVDFSPSRNTLPYVSVNDRRTQAVVQGSQQFVLAGLSSGNMQVSEWGSWHGTSAASIWLDDRRLLVVNLAENQAMIQGDAVSEGERTPIELPAECGDATWQALSARRADGRVVLLVAGARLLIDPNRRTAVCDETKASALTSDGELLVRFAQDEASGGEGLVEVFAADTMRKLGSVVTDAAPLPVADLTPAGRLVVLTHDAVRGVVEAVAIDTSQWTVSATQVLKTVAQERTPMYGARANRGRVVVQEGTTVVLYDLASGARIPLIKISNSVTADPGFGFSPDGRTLAVSAHADGKLYVLPLDPTEWSTIACGRLWGASPGIDLASRLEESKNLVQGCKS